MLKKKFKDIFLRNKTAQSQSHPVFPIDMEEDFKIKYLKCRDFTMVGVEGLYANYQAINYIVKNKIPGAIVECGVWKGGSMMMMIFTLLDNNINDRDIYLYDTFSGMTQPEAIDKKTGGESALKKWQELNNNNHNEWCFASLDEVKENLQTVGYPMDKIHFVKGEVEQTIPAQIPEKIALLRLDTDWYKSTYHELMNLYPRLEKNGVLIIDDYGCWEGARQAVDQYFKENNIQPLLNRVDATRRMMIKN